MKAFFNLFTLLCFVGLQAHTVWIETANKAEVNQNHEIKIFFGEPNSPTPTARWFSDIKDLEVKIISPSGNVSVLTEKVQSENYYSTYFVPKEKGAYVVSVNHVVGKTHRGMKIRYQSVAYFNTDSKNVDLKMGDEPLAYQMNTTPFKLNESKKIKLFKNGEPKAKEKLTAVYENGWEKSFRSDDNGEVTFEPAWKGKYLLEYSQSTKETGVHNGEDYNIFYEMITYSVNVL